jgi:hypothetical protein
MQRPVGKTTVYDISHKSYERTKYIVTFTNNFSIKNDVGRLEASLQPQSGVCGIPSKEFPVASIEGAKQRHAGDVADLEVRNY